MSDNAPPTHPARLPEEELAKHCRSVRLRRSGPGGQHRNKVETAVQLTHEPTGLTAEANERRSQAQNLAVATQRLRVRLAVEYRTDSELLQDASPSDLWRGRSRGGRLAVSRDHTDYPALLAEALDMLHANGGDDRRAADKLGVSRTQLVRFLQTEPRAIARLNEARRAAGLPELR